MRHLVVYKIVLKPFHVQHKLSMAPSDNTIVRSYISHRGEGKDIQLMLNMILPLYSMHWKLLCNSFKHDSPLYKETDFISYLARSSDSNTGFGIVVPAIPV